MPDAKYEATRIDAAQRIRLRRTTLPEAKHDVARRDAAQRMRLRCAVLPEAEHKVERNVDTQRKRLKRSTLTQIERNIAQNVDAQQKRYNIEGPLLPVANRDFVGIARGPVINVVVQRYSLGDICFTCLYCNAIFFRSEQTSGTKSSPQFSKCCNNGRLAKV